MKKGIFWIWFFFPFFIHTAVYDCFPFYNEIELLKMRLEELDPVVDYFVLVESAETQRGDPKPFYFAENRHLFEKYVHKIIHIQLEERHPTMGLWERENYQRNCIARGLTHCRPRDIILVSDLDEIPRASLIKEIVHSPRYLKVLLGSSIALEMSIYFYQLNRQTVTKETWGGGSWVGTVIAYYQNIERTGAQHLRDHRGKGKVISQGGWHFTWMGGKERIRQKLGSVVEGRDMAQAVLVSDEEIEQWIQGHPVVPVDASFPEYVRKNQAYLRSIGYLAE